MDQVGRFLLLNGEEVTVDAPSQAASLMQWKLALLQKLAGVVPSHHWLEILKDGEPVGATEPVPLHPNHEYRVVALRVPDLPPSVSTAIQILLKRGESFPDPYVPHDSTRDEQFLGGLWRIYRDEIARDFEPLAQYEKHGKAGWWLRVSERFREHARFSGDKTDLFRFARFDTTEGGEFLQWVGNDRAAALLLCSVTDRIFPHLSEAMRADKAIAENAVLHCEHPDELFYYHAFRAASPELRGSLPFCQKALSAGRARLQDVVWPSEGGLLGAGDYRELVLQGLRFAKEPFAAHFYPLNAQLKQDAEVVRIAVARDPRLLGKLSVGLRDDKDLVLWGLKAELRNKSYLLWGNAAEQKKLVSGRLASILALASERLQKDPDILGFCDGQ